MSEVNFNEIKHFDSIDGLIKVTFSIVIFFILYLIKKNAYPK